MGCIRLYAGTWPWPRHGHAGSGVGSSECRRLWRSWRGYFRHHIIPFYGRIGGGFAVRRNLCRESGEWTGHANAVWRSEEHTSELQSLMRISYAVFCLKKKIKSKSLSRNTHVKITHHNKHVNTC